VADRRELARLVAAGWMDARDRVGRTGCFGRPYVSTAPRGCQSSSSPSFSRSSSASSFRRKRISQRRVASHTGCIGSA